MCTSRKRNVRVTCATIPTGRCSPHGTDGNAGGGKGRVVPPRHLTFEAPMQAEPWATNAAGRARPCPLVGEVGAVHGRVPHLDAVTAVVFRRVESLVGAIDQG